MYDNKLRTLERESITEIEIDGKRVFYDACSSRDTKEEAIKEYESWNNEYVKWEYIGSGFIYYFDGHKNESKNVLHCFKKILLK